LRTEFHFSTSGDIYATHLAEPPATHQEGGDTVQQVELHGISAQLPVYLSTKLTYSGDTVTIEVALQQPGNATLTLQYFLAGDGVKLLSGSVDSPPGNGTPPFLTIAMKMCDAVLTETLSGPLPLRSPATWQAPGVKVDNSPYVAAVLSGIGRATARMADCLIDLLEHPH
jgi:hypothetical protein